MARAENGRAFEDIRFAATPGVFRDCDYDMMMRYAELGVDEVVVNVVCDGLELFTRRADQLEKELIRRAGGV